MDQIINWANGNPGALNFLMEVYANPSNFAAAATIDAKLRECKSIRGWRLYTLYSDLCNQDLSNVVKLCMKCPNSVLEDACGREDRSGRKLVADFL